MTANDVAVAAGLQPFSSFDKARRFAATYGCEPRRTGRSKEALCAAIAAAASGKRVVHYVTSMRDSARLADEARQLLAQMKQRDLHRADSQRGVLCFVNGGELWFVSSRQRAMGMVGMRVDAEFRDHFGGEGTLLRKCLHRVERAKRRCAVCGLKLRSRARLKVPRLRERMRQADAATFDALGIPSLEATMRVRFTERKERYAEKLEPRFRVFPELLRSRADAGAHGPDLRRV